VDGTAGGLAEQIPQSLNPACERRMGRQQIVEKALTGIAGAFERIDDEQVSYAARGIRQRRLGTRNVFEGTQQ
jgi:hypothetical protein